MPITISCVHCEKKLKVPDTAPGKKVRCPQCGQVFLVPAESTTTANVEGIRPVKAVPPPVPAPLPPAPMPLRSEPRSAEDATHGEGERFAPITFNVIVKNDPARELKGGFEAKVDRRGMTIRQNKKEIEIPIGTAVEYLRGNHLRLAVSDRQTEIAVLGQTVYQQFGQRLYLHRFTKDLAQFVSGKKPRLDIAEYKIPTSLMVLAVLPVGLLLAGIGAAVANAGARSGFVTGGVWGGLGALLAGLCVWVSQREQLPIAARTGIAAGVNVLGYAAFGIFMFWSIGGPLHWTEFAPPGGGFSVVMPGTPTKKEQTAPGPVGPIQQIIYAVEKRREAFLVSYNDYPPQVLVNDVETLFDSVQQGAAVGVNGRIVASRKVALDRHAGREVEFEIPGKGTMIVHYYLAGERFYQVGIIGPAVKPDAPEVRKMFESFRIVQK